MNVSDNFGSTPLHKAAAKSYECVSRLLEEKTIDLTKRDEKGSTPLHSAAYPSHENLLIIFDFT